jgi:AcrR family transcriptional regulator
VTRTTDARQRMIISAALLQRERGVPGTGIPDVLKHSGAPRGSVYHHFPDGRAQVAQEATAWASDFMGAALEVMLAEQTIDQALDSLSATWATLLRDTDFAAGCAVAAGALDYTDDSGARAAAATGFDRWCAAIATALRRAGMPADRADQLAAVTIASFEGALVLCRAKRSLTPLETVTRHLHETVALELSRP